MLMLDHRTLNRNAFTIYKKDQWKIKKQCMFSIKMCLVSKHMNMKLVKCNAVR